MLTAKSRDEKAMFVLIKKDSFPAEMTNQIIPLTGNFYVDVVFALVVSVLKSRDVSIKNK